MSKSLLISLLVLTVSGCATLTKDPESCYLTVKRYEYEYAKEGWQVIAANGIPYGFYSQYAHASAKVTRFVVLLDMTKVTVDDNVKPTGATCKALNNQILTVFLTEQGDPLESSPPNNGRVD